MGWEVNEEQPKLNRWGKVSSPPLTDNQKKTLIEQFALGVGPTHAAKEAGCTVGRAKGFRNEQKTALAIKDLQTTSTLVLGQARLADAMDKQTQAIIRMETRLRANEQETRKLRASVAYQRLKLTKTRETEKMQREEIRALKKLLHKKTGLDLN